MKVWRPQWRWIAFPTGASKAGLGLSHPVAEFTPKSVQTEELRTSLVYEVRVFVKDPSDELRLGMPATVYLNTGRDKQRSGQGEEGDKETRSING